MSTIGYLKGHKIHFDIYKQEWLFSDTLEPTVTTWKDRECSHCGLNSTEEGHDGCLGTLPNVINACCGHGDTESAYIMFEDKTIIRGKESIKLMEEMQNEI